MQVVIFIHKMQSIPVKPFGKNLGSTTDNANLFHYPMCLNALLNPDNPSIVSLIEVADVEEADEDR